MFSSTSPVDSQQVLDDNRRLRGNLQRRVAELTAVNELQQTDIESLKQRLEQFGAENDDLLEKLAEMKRDRMWRERQFDEQMKEVAEKVRQLEDNQDSQRETREQTEAAHRLQEELDAERRRYTDLERTHVELLSRLQVALQLQQSSNADESYVEQMQLEQRLEHEVRALMNELTATRQQLTNQASANSQAEQLMRETAELEEKNRELLSAMDQLKHKTAISEEHEEMLRTQLHELKRTLDACSSREDGLIEQLQQALDRDQELEQMLNQMHTENSDAGRTEEMLRSDLETMKQKENERAERESKLKQQLVKAHEEYNCLSRQTQSEIDRLKQELNNVNEDVNKLKKVNLQMVNSERKLKTELKEAKADAESDRQKLQEEIYTLRIDLQKSKEECIKLSKDSDKKLEELVPREHLEQVEAELKQTKEDAEETKIKFQKMLNEQYTLHQKTQQKERKRNDEIERLRSELTTKEKLLEETEGRSLELEKKIEKLKHSNDENVKLLQNGHKKLEQTIKEQQASFQAKIEAKEAEHLVEKEHMLRMWNEKEKELKNKMRASRLEIRTEVDKVKSKCDQLELAHEEKMRQKDEETKHRVSKLKEEIDERNRLTEEANTKNKELQKIIDEQFSQMTELKTSQSDNDEMKEKVGKLERAVLRLRLENDELRENKVKNENVTVSDLQLQVNTLRQALRNERRPSADFNVLPIDTSHQSLSVEHHGRLLAEMLQLHLKTAAYDNKMPPSVEDSSTLAKQLEAERGKVRAGSERIAQLEGWLDTIYSDENLWIGPSAIRGGTKQTSQITLPPVDGASAAAADGNSKTRMIKKPRDRSTHKQKLITTSIPKRK